MTSPVKTGELFVPVPGGELYVKRWTSSVITNPVPLILLHDSLGCVALWKDFPERLCLHLRREVIAYDRLGFGLSSAQNHSLPTYFITEEPDVFFPLMLRAVNVENFALLGHSIGGAIAIRCASQFTDRCKALVTVAAQVFTERKTRAGVKAKALTFNDPDMLARLEKYHGDKSRWILDGWVQTWFSPEFDDWNLKSELRKLKCPLLAIQGDRDEYGSKAYVDTIVQFAGGAVAAKIIPDCGHFPHRDKDNMVLDLISDFLA